MFHANESKNGRGTLIVRNGKMVFHVSLAGKSILNLYAGKAENAKTDEANWLAPTLDKITYADGYSETVYGFDIPVKRLNKEFNLALVGKKGTWYDHAVSICDVGEVEKPADGVHQVRTLLDGGSGRAEIIQPVLLNVKNGAAELTVVWSSSNYDYMIVDEKKYLNTTPGENSTFTFPVQDLTKPLQVQADTTAMGNPHEIDYTITVIW